jgi:hypothetical protein
MFLLNLPTPVAVLIAIVLATAFSIVLYYIVLTYSDSPKCNILITPAIEEMATKDRTLVAIVLRMNRPPKCLYQ